MTPSDRKSRSDPLQDLSLTSARTALRAGRPKEAAEWLATVPETKRPAELVAAVHYGLARLAVAELRWADAVREMTTACKASPTPFHQQRLAHLRKRQPLMDDRSWASMSTAIDAASRLARRSLAPEISALWAAGAYYSRGRGRSAPWSRYLRISKEPPGELNEREAIFRLAGGYLARYLAENTDALTIAEVVVPVPANPERYVRRMASLPDELARAIEAQLGLPAILMALAWADTGIEAKALSRGQRRNALADAIARGSEGDAVAGRVVLLVDDITTSGATLRAAGAALRALGASNVVAATLSHTEG